MLQNIALRISREDLKPTSQVRNIIFSAPDNTHYDKLVEIATKYIVIRSNQEGSIEGYIEFKNPKSLRMLFNILGVTWWSRQIPPEEIVNRFSSGDFEVFGETHSKTRKPKPVKTRRSRLENPGENLQDNIDLEKKLKDTQEDLQRYIDYSNELELDLEKAKSLLLGLEREKDEIIRSLTLKITSLKNK